MANEHAGHERLQRALVWPTLGIAYALAAVGAATGHRELTELALAGASDVTKLVPRLRSRYERELGQAGA